MRAYQSHRKDLLVNTNWGIPKEEMPEEEARSRGLVCFHGRWVTPSERERLKDEVHAYRSVRILGCLLLLLAAQVAVLGVPAMIKDSRILQGSLGLLFSVALLTSGVGLLRYRTWGRATAAVVFILFLALPFLPIMGDDKGSPFIAFIGIIGLYHLYRKTARQIFRGRTPAP